MIKKQDLIELKQQKRQLMKLAAEKRKVVAEKARVRAKEKKLKAEVKKLKEEVSKNPIVRTVKYVKSSKGKAALRDFKKGFKGEAMKARRILKNLDKFIRSI